MCVYFLKCTKRKSLKLFNTFALNALLIIKGHLFALWAVLKETVTWWHNIRRISHKFLQTNEPNASEENPLSLKISSALLSTDLIVALRSSGIMTWHTHYAQVHPYQVAIFCYLTSFSCKILEDSRSEQCINFGWIIYIKCNSI